MILLVCGGRTYVDRDRLWPVLDALRPEAVMHGGAPGADFITSTWVGGQRLVHERVFAADWKAHGRAAGPLRNQQMLDEGQPDLVLACPGGRGTADMVRRAEMAGVPVLFLAQAAKP